MSSLVKVIPQTLPVFIRKQILTELFKASADAFGCPVPAFSHLSYDEYLRAYALFTREQAEKTLQSGRDLSAVKTLLYQKAYSLGSKVRKWLGVAGMGEVMEIWRILYRAIEIDIQGDTQGEVTVKSCYFGQFYSCQVCELISAMDDGVFSGLSGGGRLTFSERITGGMPCCRAKLQFQRSISV